MDLELKGRAAIVTGGSRGIGLAVVRRLLSEGGRVAFCGRDPDRRAQTAAVLRAPGGDVLAVRCDTSDSGQRASFVEQAASVFGRIDILVNSAGTHVRGNLDTMRDEDLQRQLNDKLFGFFGMIRESLPHMRRQKDGRIVNIIGQATRHPHPDRMPSGITNAAAQAMTKSVADAVARDNIRVNSVCPQYVETDIITTMLAKEMRERELDRATAASGFTRANVLGRLGQPEEIADLVAFIVSDRANFVTGSSVSIDGGYSRYVFG
jgi:NAD(P)-dependent dehydrogenase (short-subunit alcohol dehydrogenase family)